MKLSNHRKSYFLILTESTRPSRWCKYVVETDSLDRRIRNRRARRVGASQKIESSTYRKPVLVRASRFDDLG